MIDKDEALKLAKKHSRGQFPSVDQVTDRLPDGTCYWTLKGKQEDYWYIPVPDVIPMQTGGNTSYYAVSKQSGKVSTIEVLGE